MKLYLDPGHGGSDPGASGNGLKEKDINIDIALRIRSLLTTNYENVQVRMSRTNDSTKSLQQRTNEANRWRADFYMSIHCNSFNGVANGYEDYIHNLLSDQSRTANYQDILHDEIIKVNRLNNRGQKKANFHVLRESTMDAFLSENGFIDNSKDAALMKQTSWRQKVAEGHVNGLVKAFKLNRKTTNPSPGDPSNPNTLFKVIAGSFKSKKNADARVTFLKGKGVEAFVTTATISNERWYRVQAGAFSNRKNAEERLNTIENTGVDAFIEI
ncbi:N-acetylmuramoyl-L-alanine amidase [Oceanobacillus chungangensis]|uniref:N-acetylmuramoyl-L-alanine amidase n=1 Tax=Oceanobacillus chungangensis TaxID=1229152 RepID=A0A3D8PMR6_9BACI|nr:N-acetylmuramoyl-L-alanine amidase [Oceanobacillus chungangensis]RDW17406.1 N-acetylmuramoyl-L-alanine amidase [Oceanobacillus chungangensis]